MSAWNWPCIIHGFTGYRYHSTHQGHNPVWRQCHCDQESSQFVLAVGIGFGPLHQPSFGSFLLQVCYDATDYRSWLIGLPSIPCHPSDCEATAWTTVVAKWKEQRLWNKRWRFVPGNKCSLQEFLRRVENTTASVDNELLKKFENRHNRGPQATLRTGPQIMSIGIGISDHMGREAESIIDNSNMKQSTNIGHEEQVHIPSNIPQRPYKPPLGRHIDEEDELSAATLGFQDVMPRGTKRGFDEDDEDLLSCAFRGLDIRPVKIARQDFRACARGNGDQGCLDRRSLTRRGAISYPINNLPQARSRLQLASDGDEVADEL